MKEDRVFHASMGAVCAFALAWMTWEIPHSRLWVSPRDLVGLLFALATLSALAGYCHWRGYEKLRDSLFLLGWSFILTNLLVAAVYVAGRTGSHLADSSLMRADRLIRLESPMIVQFVARHPAVRTFSSIVYDLMYPLLVVALVLPAFACRKAVLKRLTLGMTLAAVMTVLFFALLPAIGPWTVYGFAPSADQAHTEELLKLMKSAAAIRVVFKDCAVISFPSFHVVIAVLSAIALWGWKKLRWPAAFLAALICMSTITTGWHYVVDVVGGLALAFMTDAVAVRLLALEQRFALSHTGAERVQIPVAEQVAKTAGR